jgi:uncharacterized surface protein with fasciclin (FAS1) repeats
MSAGRKTIILHTAVWGDWHIDALVNVTIPTLLAPGNLPHMARHHAMGYVISTRPSDKPRIEAAVSVQRLKQVIPVEIQPTLPDIGSNENVFNIHHVIWRSIEDQVKGAGALMWNMPPDVAFGDGAGITLTKLLAAGKRSIMWWYSRTADTLIPVLKQQHLRADGTMTVPPRQLVELSFQHMHPLSNAYFVDSPCFASFHPEMLQWRVGENAMLVRLLASGNWLYEPGHFKLTHQNLLDGELNFDEIAVIGDSDDLFAASLAPVKHNAEWHEKPATLDRNVIAWWWQAWHSPSNDFIAGHAYRMHTDHVPEEVWRPYERRSERLVRNVALRRQTFDLTKAALEVRCTWTAGLLTSLGEMKARLLTALFPTPVKVIVFGPTDEAAKQIPVPVSQQMMRPADTSRLRQFVASHVVIDPAPETLLQRLQVNGGTLRLRSVNGTELTVATDAAGRISVNGVALIGPLTLVRGHLFVPTAGILDQDLARDPPVSVATA